MSSPVETQTERASALVAWVEKRHGVAHSSEARAAGFRPSEVAFAVSTGLLTRVRRSWLHAPACDRRRVAAARVGGRVTCVSAASMLGLWTPPHDEVHVAVPGSASRLESTGLRLHWGTGPAPVGPQMTEDPVVNVLFHVAHCLTIADALAVWESAIRKRLTEPAILARVAWRSTDAALLAGVASSLSDSGLESHFLRGMRAAGIAIRQQVWLDGHPVDGLIGERLVVQLDGFAYHQAEDRRRDIEADARLMVRGFHVLRFDYHQILFGWDDVLETITTAMAQGLHRAPTSRT